MEELLEFTNEEVTIISLTPEQLDKHINDYAWRCWVNELSEDGEEY